MKELKYFKQNNKGMTLIECIISIVILSICIIPLLSTFSFCYKYTARAKMRQKATNIAQDVIETYKADDIDIIMQKIISSETSISGQNVLNSARPDYSESYIPTIDGVNDGTGYYLYSNLTAPGSGDKYDAIVKVTAGNVAYNPTTNPGANDYTSTDLFNGPEDSYVISQDVALYSTMLTVLSSGINDQFNMIKNNGILNNPSVVDISVSREMQISYVDAAEGEANTHRVEMNTEYVFTIKYMDLDESQHIIPDTDWYGYFVFDKDDAGFNSLYSNDFVGDINSVSVFYYPLYDAANTVYVPKGYKSDAIINYIPVKVTNDSINVTNTVSKIDLNIYKQRYSEVKNADDIISYTQYDANYNIIVTTPSGASFQQTGLLGNISNNIYSSVESGGSILDSTGITEGTLKEGSVFDSASTTNNQLVCILDVYVFGHGEAGDLSAISSYTAASAIVYSNARADVQATIVDNIEY